MHYPFSEESFMSARHVLLILTCLALSACASKFPSPEWAVHSESSLNGVKIFTNTFNTHGGESLDQLNDVSVSITGKWKKLIRKSGYYRKPEFMQPYIVVLAAQRKSFEPLAA
jgi:hypothetical protein